MEEEAEEEYDEEDVDPSEAGTMKSAETTATETHSIADYKSTYEKVSRIGSGNSGTAWLVRNKSS
jgi:hypothetical protein